MTEALRLIAETTSAILAAHPAPPEAVRPFASDAWIQLEKAGLTMIGRQGSEEGGGALEASEVVRAAGLAAAPLPLSEALFVAIPILARADIPVPLGPLTIGTLANDGTPSPLVEAPWALEATTVILVPDDSNRYRIRCVRIHGQNTDNRPNLAGEPRDSFGPDDDYVVVVVDTEAPVDLDPRELWLRGALGRAIAAGGALEGALSLGLRYARDREQFGRPIARFQAVQHLLAGAAVDVAAARGALGDAVDSLVSASSVTEMAGPIAAAKVRVGRSVDSVTRRIHQVHGAIGVTREYPLQALTRAALAWRDEFGTEHTWADALGGYAQDEGRGLWAYITD